MSINEFSSPVERPADCSCSRGCGTNEIASYTPLVVLCNKILDELQKPALAVRLNGVLKENNTHPIQFVRYENLTLLRDFPSPDRHISGRPDILIALKDGIQDYALDQSKSKNSGEFDPSLKPDRARPSRIIFKDVLGCMEIKWESPCRGGSAEVSNDVPSQSSQSNVPGVFIESATRGNNSITEARVL